MKVLDVFGGLVKWLYMFFCCGRIEVWLLLFFVSIILFLCFYKIYLSLNLVYMVVEKENNKIFVFFNVFNLYILEIVKLVKCFLFMIICILFKILKLYEVISFK